jgi:hypothetical protein
MRMILLTGYPHRGVDRAAYDAGTECVLTKACLREHREEHVSEVLGRATPLEPHRPPDR